LRMVKPRPQKVVLVVSTGMKKSDIATTKLDGYRFIYA
jgi:hypothetical protein